MSGLLVPLFIFRLLCMFLPLCFQNVYPACVLFLFILGTSRGVDNGHGWVPPGSVSVPTVTKAVNQSIDFFHMYRQPVMGEVRVL